MSASASCVEAWEGGCRRVRTTVADLLRMAGRPAEPLQAVLTGGYGGTWIPLKRVHTATTPAAFADAGAALGPGIIVALPTRACGLAESAGILRQRRSVRSVRLRPARHR
jgi:hypothetical protein